MDLRVGQVSIDQFYSRLSLGTLFVCFHSCLTAFIEKDQFQVTILLNNTITFDKMQLERSNIRIRRRI